ncbi:MAG: hypothetical protein GX941_09310 [Candidatus Methanofastidiosa archaeon]|nr:hypothetical protein [Candidatus Methanofastidiosa archaeon]NMA31983.1 hypothetical protein [Candidatus Methanofastidiosa archaeon]
MEEGKKDFKKAYRYYFYMLWLVTVFVGAVLLFFYSANMLAGLFLLIAGLAITLIYYARSDEDEDLDTRTNYELIRFYTKAAYFLFVVLGVSLLIIVIAENIVRPLLN